MNRSLEDGLKYEVAFAADALTWSKVEVSIASGTGPGVTIPASIAVFVGSKS